MINSPFKTEHKVGQSVANTINAIHNNQYQNAKRITLGPRYGDTNEAPIYAIGLAPI